MKVVTKTITNILGEHITLYRHYYEDSEFIELYASRKWECWDSNNKVLIYTETNE